MLTSAAWAYLRYRVRAIFQHEHATVRSFGNDSAGQAVAARLREVSVVKPTALCWQMRSRGSDKGIARHNYTPLYSALFTDFRRGDVRIFELGIGTNNPSLASSMGERGRPGASLRGWAAFFPAAQIFAADIDRAILFEDQRIKTFYCDQLDPHAIGEMWRAAPLREPMQVIIEDGLHTFDANRTFLEHSIDRVAAGGYYVVEDIPSADLPAWEEILPRYAASHRDFSFHLVRIPWHRNQYDNNIVVAARGAASRS